MSSRRKFLHSVGGVTAVGTLAGTANYLDIGFVRTKAGGGFGDTIDLNSPDADTFVPPDEFGTYADQIQEQYGSAALPWRDLTSFTGEFVGAYTRQVSIVPDPDDRYAVQDAAVLVHRIEESRYQLRLWSAGRLLGRKYEVDPWGLYREDPAFTWLEQRVETERDEQLSASRALSTGGGRFTVAGGTVAIPKGSFDMGLADDTEYRSRWDGFHAGKVPLVGTCKLSFADGAEQRLDWTLSNGVGVRTPF